MERRVDLRRHDDGRDRWQVATASTIVPGVDRYSWWSEQTGSFDTRRELASTGGVFIVNLGEPIEIVDAGGVTHRVGAGQSFVGGPARATSLSRSGGTQTGLHIHLSPLTLARLLGVPLAALADHVVMLDQAIGAAATALGGQLVEARSHAERWRLLDVFLGQRLGDAPPEDREIGHAWNRLGHGAKVAVVADELGWSRKRLAERFRDATGLLPRSFAGLARFERFTALLQADPCVSLAAAAHDAGYADQAHLTRAVSRYADLSPGGLRARLIPGTGGVRA